MTVGPEISAEPAEDAEPNRDQRRRPPPGVGAAAVEGHFFLDFLLSFFFDFFAMGAPLYVSWSTVR